MTWTVVWNADVQNDLASLWLNALDRSAVRDAADAIDVVLRYDPYSNSEARDGATRVLFRPPLAIAYDVNDDDRLVTVWAVWRPLK
jgi:hypothetical protein